MGVREDYERDGYAALPGFVPPEVARALLFQIKTDLAAGGVRLDRLATASPLLKRAAIELYGYRYAPMITFLWGMTPALRAITGQDLLPTYSYFRIYRRGDICRIHSDRPSCEHSVSLTLAYSDDQPWPLEIGADHLAVPRPEVAEGFAGSDSRAVAMMPGDAVLYQGVHRRHGRTLPNPNDWSAHLFLHWVSRDGPYQASRFDGRTVPDVVEFLPPAD